MTPLFSTAYLPPIAYVAALSTHREALIEVMETFPKQTYRNRTEIMTAGGVRTLSVPVVRNNHSRTEEVGIDYKERWNIIHLRTIAAAYSASPYYLYYKDELEEILMQRYERLVDLNDALLQWILRTLKSDCQVHHTQEFVKDDVNYGNHTALMEAARCGTDAKLVNMLLAAGANVNARDTDERTALYHAVNGKCSIEVIDALLAAGAEVNAQNKNGLTPLMREA